jgi:hypothetical protein
MNRMIGIAALLAMIVANIALLTRDVIPAWTAGDPPIPLAYEMDTGWIKVSQTGIYDAAGSAVGHVWTETWRDKGLVTVESMTILNEVVTSGQTLISALRIDTRLTYNEEQVLERLDVTVRGFGLPIELHGKYVPPDDFACEWQFDEETGTFSLPADATRAMGDLRSPFQGVGGLQVGQVWRHELFDPLSGMLPGLSGSGMKPQSMIVSVTGTDKIIHHDLAIKAFVLEGDSVRAWVSPLGDVLRQEVTVPVLGRIVLLDEPFDDNARAEARQRIVEVQ